MALQVITDNILKHKSNKQATLAIYVDLSKAYDTISHTKLLNKLIDDFNFTADTVQFFKSYFENRTQTTHTQHAKYKIITHGIPQGSTLSTTFFLLYINDIKNTVPNSKVYTYADDTTLIITAKDTASARTIRTHQLFPQQQPSPKTNYTIFYPHKKHEEIHLHINGKTIEQNTDAKLLGIFIQNNLKYNKTISNIIKKLWPTIHSFKYANKLLPTENMKQLYYSQVYPHLLNAISVWGTDNNTRTYLKPLVTIQKRIIRLIANVPPRTHTKPIMTKLEILNIPNLYTLRVSVEMHPFAYPTRPRN